MLPCLIEWELGQRGCHPLCSSQRCVRLWWPPKHLQLVAVMLSMPATAPGIGKDISDSSRGRCGAWGQRGVVAAKTASKEQGIFLHLLPILAQPPPFYGFFFFVTRNISTAIKKAL